MVLGLIEIITNKQKSTNKSEYKGSTKIKEKIIQAQVLLENTDFTY